MAVGFNLQILSQLDHDLPRFNSDVGDLYALDENGEGDTFDTTTGKFGLVFVGGLIFRLDALGGVSSTAPSSNHWELCDGGTISNAESIWDGKVLPTLNGDFLRGTTGATGGTGGSTSHSHTVTQRPTTIITMCTGSGSLYSLNDNNDLSSLSANHEPPYYEAEIWLRIA